jgi:hypothetical protein
MSTNALIPRDFGAVSTKFANLPQDASLSEGVQGGFAMIGYKGKVWSIRARGQTHNLMRDDGDGPRGSIEVVILKASPKLGKIFYVDGYEEGSAAPPDCYSTNGVTPDPGAQKKQSVTCLTCTHNGWGTGKGGRGKACSDSRRLAVVPQLDLKNELFEGAMLLRVPAASLADLADFGKALAQMGYPYYGVATKVSFDSKESYPKFAFSAIRPLTDAEAEVVLELQASPKVSRILDSGPDQGPAVEETKPGLVFEQAPKQQEAASLPQKVTTPATPGVVPMGTGFGPMTGTASTPSAPVAEPKVLTPATAQPHSSAAELSSTAQPAGGVGAAPLATPTPSFEDDLDAQLDAILPS